MRLWIIDKMPGPFRKQDARSFPVNFQPQAVDTSFADILNPAARVRATQPVRKGDFLSVNINDALHQ